MTKSVTGQHSDRLLLGLNLLTINPRKNTMETYGTAAKFPKHNSYTNTQSIHDHTTAGSGQLFSYQRLSILSI